MSRPAAIINSPSVSSAPLADTSLSSGTDVSVHTDPCTLTRADGYVRTRAGRLVKSVNRLIESMVQSPLLRVKF